MFFSKKGGAESPQSVSKRNKAGLCRSIFFMTDSSDQIANDLILLEYHHNVVRKEKVEFKVPSYGNRKSKESPFYPQQKSVLNEMNSEERTFGSYFISS